MDEAIQIGRQEQEQLIRATSMMNEVAKRIKQIPELPSEIPTDSHPLLKVEFPDEGEILTFMKDYDYPYRGYPFYEFVDKIDLIKKLSRQMQSGFYHGLKNKWYRWLLIPLISSLGRSVFWACTYSFHRLITRFQMRTNRYSRFVQELHRAASVNWGDEKPQITDLRKMLRDIECMILEFDNAYRFRVQDLIPEINKEALRKYPRKEIIRLLDIWIEREKSEEIKDSWRLLRLFVKYYLRFDKPLLQMIARILLELEIEKCKLNVEDKYYAVPRLEYTFAFMQNPSKDDGILIKKVRCQQKYEEKKKIIQKQSTVEHEILAQAHLKERTPLLASSKIISKVEEERKKLEAAYQAIVMQNEKKYQEEEEKVMTNFLNSEQRILLDKQKAETEALDKRFETELAKIEKSYLLEKAKL